MLSGFRAARSKKEQPPEGTSTVVVDSIGSADLRSLHAVALTAGLDAETLAKQVLQAPVIVASGLSEAAAMRIARQLSEAGAECGILVEGGTVQVGSPDLDVALVLHEFDRMSAVVAALSNFLDVPRTRAQQLLCQVPAVVLQGVSATVVQPLRRRFEPLGASIDVSQRYAARYEILVRCSANDRRVAELVAHQMGLRTARADGPEPQLLTGGLTFDQATELLAELSSTTLPVRKLSRDHIRYDVRLDKIEFTEKSYQFLAEMLDEDIRTVTRLAKRLPTVTHRNVTFADTAQFLRCLSAIGGRATPQMLPTKAYSLDVEPAPDPARAKHVLVHVGRVRPEDADRIAHHGGRVDGPLTNTAAYWLCDALHRAGVRSHLFGRNERPAHREVDHGANAAPPPAS